MKTLTYIRTTLYDLIEAIVAEVRPDEEALVTATAVELLRSHKAKFIGKRVGRSSILREGQLSQLSECISA